MILESAWRNLIRQKQRSAASLTAVAFSIVALLGATGFNSALFKEFREATIHSETGHLQVSRTGFQMDGRSDPSSYLLEPEPPVDVDQLSVTAVLAPRLLVNGLVSYGDRTQPFIAQGVDPAVDMGDDRGLRISDGRRLRADDHRQVILGSELSRTLGVAVGSAVVLLVNTTDGQLSAAEAEVVGLFEAFSKEFENSALVMPLMLAQDLLQEPGVHVWRVFLEDTSKTDTLKEEVISLLENPSLEVHAWSQLAEFYRRASALFDQQIALLQVIVVAILLLGVTNSLLMSVIERTGEIGTIMALGRRRNQVLLGFLAEGLLLGLVGSFLGIILLFCLTLLLQVFAIEMPPPPTFSRPYILALDLSLKDRLWAVVLVSLTTTIAASYPAWKASRMEIVASLRSLR